MLRISSLARKLIRLLKRWPQITITNLPQESPDHTHEFIFNCAVLGARKGKFKFLNLFLPKLHFYTLFCFDLTWYIFTSLDIRHIEFIVFILGPVHRAESY